MKCAVLGDPVAHSLSPALHRAAYAALGLDWDYEAIQVPAGTLAAFLDGLDDRWRGLSLTMPLKREMVPLLTASDDWTRLTGAANTVVLDGSGGRFGLNTDVPGAKAAITEQSTASFPRAVVLGAGATAASVVFALAELGLERVTILAREPDRASETVRVIATGPIAVDLDVRPLLDAGAAADGADIVVSTVPTSVQVPGLVAALADVPVVFDVIYDSWPTPLAASAQSSGRTLVSGLDLLLAQARGQVEAMTGAKDVPLEEMRAAAERILAGGGEVTDLHPVAAAVAGVVAFPSGLALPWLIGRLPEPEEEHEADQEDNEIPARDPEGEAKAEEAKEPYAAIAALPGLGWKSALAAAACAAPIGLVTGWEWSLVLLVVLVPVSIALAVIDWRTRLLPTALIAPTYGVLLGLVLVGWLVTRDTDDVIRAGWGWLLAGGLYLVLWFIYPKGMGYGDVRLSGILGIALGYAGWSELIVGIYGGFILGGIIGGLLALLRRVDRAGYPYGPFMLLGALVGVLVGPLITSALMS